MYKLLWTVLLLNIFVLCSGADNVPAKAAVPLWLEKARNGDAKAQLQAGFFYFKSNNPVLAAYWFNAAAQQNIPEAQYNLGRCFLEGYGVEKNSHAALQYFQQASGHELPEAQLALAQLYLSGIAAETNVQPPQPEIPPNESKAYELLEMLIKKDLPAARIIYANYLLKHHYQTTPPEKILQLLDPLVQKDHAAAQIMLADYLLSRNDIYRDEQRARTLLEKAAGKSPAALAKLAWLVENGLGAPPDPEKAFKLYEQVLSKEFNAQAAVRLGNYYLAGRNGAPQDVRKAFELYKQAADTGLPEAIYNLANCYSSGLGVEADPEKAFELYFQAARMDYPPAQYALGRSFEKSQGTAQDHQAAFFWYRQAALRYEPRSMLEAGRRLLEGHGTEQNVEQAVIFLKQALANGMNEAAILLEKAANKPATPLPEPRQLPSFRLKAPAQAR